ncbi:MAG: Post-segregation antitoxin CcdA [Pseudomonadota bacterium]
MPLAMPYDADNPTYPAPANLGAQRPGEAAMTSAPSEFPKQGMASNAAVASTANEGARWLAENQTALQSSNEFVSQRGLPLDRYRAF